MIYERDTMPDGTVYEKFEGDAEDIFLLIELLQDEMYFYEEDCSEDYYCEDCLEGYCEDDYYELEGLSTEILEFIEKTMRLNGDDFQLF